jgi:RNA polymerase sigma-70 factor (ECF subfamily)
MWTAISYSVPLEWPSAAFLGALLSMSAGHDDPKSNDAGHGLIRRIAAGDQQALRSLYVHHHLRVYRFIARMLRDSGAAEDVLAEVFLDVWQQAGRFAGRSSVNTWLCAIARNKALAHLRKYPSPVDAGSMADAADEADTPEVSLQKLDKSERLKRCIEMLGLEHREVIDLVYYHEKSVEEVSHILDIPSSTVKTRMFYARKKLSEFLGRAGIDRGWP